MDEQDGVVWAYHFDESGAARELAPEQMTSEIGQPGWLWVHVNRKSPGIEALLRERLALDPLVCEALLAEETRPRSVLMGSGLLTILRGVNLNPGADPEDMVSVRLWVDEHVVVSLRGRRAMAMQDVRGAIGTSESPAAPGDFLVQVASRLIDRMGPALEDLDERVDNMEEQVVEAQSHELRAALGSLRREAIALRRYLAPQRDALSRIQTERAPWLAEAHRSRLHEVTDRLTRYVEDLDAARERAAVTQEELASRLSEQTNRTMYVLSLVAAVFLPLGLLTGLLGINVGGIPGTENPWAFTVVCVILVVLAAIQIWLFHRRKML